MTEYQYEGKIMYRNKTIADSYDSVRFSSVKGRFTDIREKFLIMRAIDFANIKGPVLDIPCGTGRIMQLLLERGYHVTGADISDAMMRHARERTKQYASRVQFKKGNIEDLEFDDNSFEAIIAIRFLHHVPARLHTEILKEVHRVTRRWVVLTYSNKYTVQNIRRDLISIFTKFPRYSISPNLFKQEVKEAQFKIVKYMPLMPIFSESVVVLLEKRQNFQSK